MSAIYQLLDFGNGRKLERFGVRLVNRPCPAADGAPRWPGRRWEEADIAYDLTARQGWTFPHPPPDPWLIEFGPLKLQLRCTPFGHLGVFPEQAANWQWLRQIVEQATRSSSVAPIRCLNLFAYTGASTLAMAQGGGHVVHVDSSRPTLEWARENARCNELTASPIRWLHEDARRFVERELRRGNRYEVIVLDPPSYGHGPKGESWSFAADMAPLLANVFELLSERAVAVLWTGHSDSRDLRPLVTQAAQHAASCGLDRLEDDRATIDDSAHRPLDCGYRLRWSGNR